MSKIVSLEEVSTHTSEIWRDDLLGREKDAHAVQQLCIARARARRRSKRDSAFTLGIDAPYGVGKTFFLKRLYAQVSLRHPTAFIDAWADDTIDSPWAALLIAVDDALKPFSSVMDSELAAEVGRRGKELIVALAKGAARKGASYVIGDEGWSDVTDALFTKIADDQVSAFKERKLAVEAVSVSLKKLIMSVDNFADYPVFIFVDELDRCKPTYAIKFLEEIKHLLDIPGLVFIFAVNTDQLTKSISKVYGGDFKSKDYLSRFIEKTYRLDSPKTGGLVRYLARSLSINLDKTVSPNDLPGTNTEFKLDFIADCMSTWQIAPRDIVRVMDGISTFIDLWQENTKIELGLAIPHVIMDVLSISATELEQRTDATIAIKYNIVPHLSVKDRIYSLIDIYKFLRTNRSIDFYHFINLNRQLTGIEIYLSTRITDEQKARSPIDPTSLTLLSGYSEHVRLIARIKS